MCLFTVVHGKMNRTDVSKKNHKSVIKVVVDLSMESKCFMIKLICLWKCSRFQFKKSQEVLFSRAKQNYTWPFV